MTGNVIEGMVGAKLTECYGAIQPLPQSFLDIIDTVTIPRRPRRATLLMRSINLGRAVFALIGLVLTTYLVKSKLGIDLMDGPSPLHYLFFN